MKKNKKTYFLKIFLEEKAYRIYKLRYAKIQFKYFLFSLYRYLIK